ncbi:beta-1,6-N-acetylglucosaminyltransferase [Fibrella aquatilis]|uniref:Peptide O-xylosyltransferase n=1 Tax=Fibrella aquatilis TaxID=2817059 RepID=A0A939G5S7_9BACT|nr:beta-1,6-N-acetylglucosaminyltransferase [Fibrella aquatilis]MBO0932907.1 hypothetical protein [Fibrella aquatilis]
MATHTVAYLILAHRQPGMLYRLALALAHPQARLFVHLDARVDLATFMACRDWPESLAFIDERLTVWHKGYSMVEAELALIRAAGQSGYSFRYLKLLSGDSFPLCSAFDLIGFFAQQQTDFYSFWRLADRPSWLHKVRFRYFHDYFWLNSRHTRWSHLLLRIYRRTLRGAFRQKALPAASDGGPMIPYGGAQWWALRPESAGYVVDTLAHRPDLVRFFRHTDSPDELVFQTLLQHSPYADRANRKAAYEAWSRNTPAADKQADHLLHEESFHLTYMDWSPTRELPAILDERDLDALRYTDCLFARKFDENRSGELLKQFVKGNADNTD